MLGEQEDKPQTGKKIFANDTSDKGLYSEYVKNSQNSIIRKQVTPGVPWWSSG